MQGTACLQCHSDCPTGCKGPLREDCLFNTCREYHEFFPEKSSTSGLVILRIDEQLQPIWCEPEGWTVILNNEDNDPVSSMTFASFVSAGINELPGLFFLPLMSISAMTSTQKYELRIELTRPDGTILFDHYGDFSLQTNMYALYVNHKQVSSPGLQSFDLGSLLNGTDFQALGSHASPTNCYTIFGTGSWYTSSCDGMALLGGPDDMFYGSLNPALSATKLLIRETHCL